MDLDVAFEHIDGIRVLHDCAALLVCLDVKRPGWGRPTANIICSDYPDEKSRDNRQIVVLSPFFHINPHVFTEVVYEALVALEQGEVVAAQLHIQPLF